MEEEIRAQLLANQAALQESATSWEDRVKEAQEDSATPAGTVSEKERKVSEYWLIDWMIVSKKERLDWVKEA